MKVTIGHTEQTALLVFENITEVFYQENYVKIHTKGSSTEPPQSWVYPYRVINSFHVVLDIPKDEDVEVTLS